MSNLLPRMQTAQRQLAFDESPAQRERTVWCAGNIDLLSRAASVAIVGTRNVSTGGAAGARRLAKELAEHR